MDQKRAGKLIRQRITEELTTLPLQLRKFLVLTHLPSHTEDSQSFQSSLPAPTP